MRKINNHKILYFIFPLSGPKNGVNIISNHILREFLKDNTITTKTIDVAQAKEYSNHGKFSIIKVLFLFRVIKNINKISKKDYVYMNFTLNGFSFVRDLILLLFIKYQSDKVVIHFHSNGLEKINNFFIKKLFKNVKIIVINEAQKNVLKKFKNIYLIKNALPDYYRDKNILFQRNQKIKLLFFSNLSVPKGIDLLEKVAAQLSKLNNRVEFNIYGGVLDAHSKKILNKICLKYKNFINYHGPIEDEIEKMKILNEHDVLLFLSNDGYEVSPLIYIESLMNGVFIITTKQVVATSIVNTTTGKILDSKAQEIEILDYIKNLQQIDRINIRDFYKKEYSFENFIDNLKKIIFNEA